jgi:hypothetical protein
MDRMTLQEKMDVDQMLALNGALRESFAALVAKMDVTTTNDAIGDLQRYTSKVMKYVKEARVRVIPRINSSPDDL